MKCINIILDFYNKYKKIIIISIFSIIAIIISIFLLFPEKETKEVIKEEIAININEEKKETIEEYYYVDIKGEVINPGVYALKKESRVIDAINASGGLKENASTKYINLSKQINDEMIIVIYSNEEIESFKEKEVIIEPCICEKITNDSCIENINTKEEKDVKININTASLEQLQELNGIGEAKAKAIVEYRTNKTFDTIEEIKEVSGISEAIYDKIKDFIITK